MSVEADMQRAAEERLECVENAYYLLEEDPDNVEAQDAVGLYCGGCATCTVREVLEAAVPVLLLAIQNGSYVVARDDVMSNVHHLRRIK